MIDARVPNSLSRDEVLRMLRHRFSSLYRYDGGFVHDQILGYLVSQITDHIWTTLLAAADLSTHKVLESGLNVANPYYFETTGPNIRHYVFPAELPQHDIRYGHTDAKWRHYGSFLAGVANVEARRHLSMRQRGEHVFTFQWVDRREWMSSVERLKQRAHSDGRYRYPADVAQGIATVYFKYREDFPEPAKLIEASAD